MSLTSIGFFTACSPRPLLSTVLGAELTVVRMTYVPIEAPNWHRFFIPTLLGLTLQNWTTTSQELSSPNSHQKGTTLRPWDKKKTALPAFPSSGHLLGERVDITSSVQGQNLFHFSDK
uniref:Secreted protein n=1 Tax=Steinernema glaseri TaxID=37863 RepID=A0A1I7YVZ3_9BILA